MILKPSSTIKARLGIEPNGRVQKYLSATCHRHNSKYVPGGTKGSVNRNSYVMNDGYVYNGPYAHYLYVGKLYIDPKTKSSYARKGITKVPTDKNLKYHTPGTGSHWEKKMWTVEKDQILKEVQNYVDRGL